MGGHARRQACRAARRIVHIPSPVNFPHGFLHLRIGVWLSQYADGTPGCQASADATWLMGPESVPQPDLTLRTIRGGRSRIEKNYLAGAPELVVEIAWSSSARDLGVKSDLYRRHGVREYLAILAQENEVLWREVVKGRYRRIAPTPRAFSTHRSFPGSGLTPAPSGAKIGRACAPARRAGLAGSEHAAFVRRPRK